MKYGSFSKIFWGLFLLFFNINFYHLNVFTSFLGALLLATATWQLRQESKSLKNAYIFSIVELIMQSTGMLMLCAHIDTTLVSSISVFTAVVGTFTMILLIYNLFSGLGQMAAAQGHGELREKLNRCYVLYTIIAIMITVAMFAPQLVVLMFPILIIVFIYILVQVHQFNTVINNCSNVFQERKLNNQYLKLLTGYILLTTLSSFFVLAITNFPNVHTEIYNKSDSTGCFEIQAIKDKMQALGFDKGIVSELPDSEIKNYQDVLSVQNCSTQNLTDGGTLKMIESVSTFQNNKIRFLFYYKWLKLPEHRFSDNLAVDVNRNLISIPYDINFSGFGLYDNKTAKGITTYKAELIKNKDSNSIPNSITPVIRYRLFGGDATNQRGFFAYNAQTTASSRGNTFETIVDYSHQTSILNFNNVNETNQDQQQMLVRQSDHFAYDRFQLVFYHEIR
jgi:hypothetical protein